VSPERAFFVSVCPESVKPFRPARNRPATMAKAERFCKTLRAEFLTAKTTRVQPSNTLGVVDVDPEEQ
jgi:hypothetical protein